MSNGWAVPVPLLPDELFSSWLVRAALAQGCDPLTLTGELWPHWRVWARDPDRGLSEERALALAKMSGVEVSTFNAASLRAIATLIALSPLERLATWPWVLACGSRNRTWHGGLQCCPLCLRSDRKPYFRKHWRLAWHTGCPVHGVRLHDRCQTCGMPIAPHRLVASDGDMATCAECGYDLRTSTHVACTPAALAFQCAADGVLVSGQGDYGAGQLSVGHWLAVSRYFVVLLRKIVLRPAGGLTAFAKGLGVKIEVLQSPKTGLALELLPVAERSMLLAGAWDMLRAGPERFLAAAMDASLTRASLRERHVPIPNLISTLIEALPELHVSRKRKASTTCSLPRSPQTVMRMFARLQRKMPGAVQ